MVLGSAGAPPGEAGQAADPSSGYRAWPGPSPCIYAACATLACELGAAAALTALRRHQHQLSGGRHTVRGQGRGEAGRRVLNPAARSCPRAPAPATAASRQASPEPASPSCLAARRPPDPDCQPGRSPCPPCPEGSLASHFASTFRPVAPARRLHQAPLLSAKSGTRCGRQSRVLPRGFSGWPAVPAGSCKHLASVRNHRCRTQLPGAWHGSSLQDSSEVTWRGRRPPLAPLS